MDERSGAGATEPLRPLTVAVCTGRGMRALASVLPSLIRAVNSVTALHLLISLDARCSARAEVEAWLSSAAKALAHSVIQAAAPGIANVRNAALEFALARGGVLVFIDDDATPCHDGWLGSLLSGFKADPRVVMTGGPVGLIPPGGRDQRPWWRSNRTDYLLSFRDSGAEAGYCEADSLPSVNIAYRLSAVQEIRFHPSLGWNGTRRNPLAGEETLFNLRLEERGGRAWFAPGAAVDHHIDDRRWTVWWLIRRAWIEGRTAVAVARIRRRRVGRDAASGLALMLVSTTKLVVRLLQLRPDLMFVQLCNAASGFGVVCGVFGGDGHDERVGRDAAKSVREE